MVAHLTPPYPACAAPRGNGNRFRGPWPSAGRV
jgi:hypothetical protein